MSVTNSSPVRPLRVAIIGAGPSGYYAAGALTAQKKVPVAVDIYDRLPTPFGLVRHGVAPDHPKIKSVIKVFEKISNDPRVRFFGNVECGSDLTHDDLKRFYDAVIYAFGASADRKLGIPGEDLSGVHSATEFVGWYNSHPDFAGLHFDIAGARNVAVIGNGNVAVDVARILAECFDVLAATDISDDTLAELAKRKIEKIYMLGRRGPAQAAFTNPELRELGEIACADLIVDPQDLELDPQSQQQVAKEKQIALNLETLREYARRTPEGRERQLVLRFLTSPVEVLGENGRMTAVKLERNELRPTPDGDLRAVGTGQFETLPCDLLFRAVGYKGIPLPGVPFDERRGVIPNEKGRVIDPQTHQPMCGEYVVGWVKRGPKGVIGTNKQDAQETVDQLLVDAASLPRVSADDPQAVVDYLRQRKPETVPWVDWQLLDKAEVERGKSKGRPRVKYNRVPEMLDAIAARRSDAGANGGAQRPTNASREPSTPSADVVKKEVDAG